MDLTVKDLSQELYTELTRLSSFVCLFVSFFLTEWGNKVSSGAPDVSAGSSPLSEPQSGGVSPVLPTLHSTVTTYTPPHCNPHFASPPYAHPLSAQAAAHLNQRRPTIVLLYPPLYLLLYLPLYLPYFHTSTL